MFNNAPLGRNLEAACKSWAFAQRALVYCACCGGQIGFRVATKDELRPHYCSPGCQAAARAEQESQK